MNCGFTVRKKEEFTLTHCTAVWKNISWKHLCNLKVWKNTEIYILSDLDKHFVKILFLLQNTVWKIKPSHTTVWKNQKFSLTKTFFHEINYLVGWIFVIHYIVKSNGEVSFSVEFNAEFDAFEITSILDDLRQLELVKVWPTSKSVSCFFGQKWFFSTEKFTIRKKLFKLFFWLNYYRN